MPSLFKNPVYSVKYLFTVFAASESEQGAFIYEYICLCFDIKSSNKEHNSEDSELNDDTEIHSGREPQIKNKRSSKYISSRQGSRFTYDKYICCQYLIVDTDTASPNSFFITPRESEDIEVNPSYDLCLLVLGTIMPSHILSSADSILTVCI